MISEFEMPWMGAIVAKFEVLPRYLPGGVEDIDGDLQSW
jgi:hypothetical protein